MSARRATPEQDVRLVPMTREQRDALESAWPSIFASPLVKGMQLVALKRILDAWDAAPADPAEAVRVLVQSIASLRDPYDAINETTRAVLVALGYPRGEEA